MRGVAGWRLASWAFACVAALVAMCRDSANITIAKLSGASFDGRHRPRPASRSTAASSDRILPACAGSQRTAASLKTKTLRNSVKAAGVRRRSKATDRFWQGILPRSATLMPARSVHGIGSLAQRGGLGDRVDEAFQGAA